MKSVKIFFLFIAISVSSLPVFSQDKAANQAVDKIVNSYLGVKNALVATNGAAAQTQAKDLLAAINDLPMDKLNADQHKAWMTYLPKLQFDSRHISETADAAHQREHFASLSNNMSSVLRGLKLNTSLLYEQYCPMKKAYWLSETEAVKNPYYGKQMLTCGETTGKLAPATK